MTDTTFIKSYKSNPKLKTIHHPQGWLGTPVDQHGRFLNLEFPFTPSLAKVIKWKLQANSFKKEKKTERWMPQIQEDSLWLQGSDDIIVWLGHSTVYIRINGVRILIDPVFGNILTIKRKTRIPVDPHLLTGLNYILLSHDHRDHMDKSSLELLAKQNPNASYKAGLGSQQLLYKFTLSRNIQTAGWYQQFDTKQDPVNITFIPTRHWSKRGLFDTNKRLWGGFIIESGDKRVLFGGDSGYDNQYRQLNNLFGPFDYAILGIGAYQPAWFMSPMHMSPSETVKAFTELKARYLIPMHYGTFDLSDEPLGLPLEDLHSATVSNHLMQKVSTLTIGKPLLIR